MSPQSEFPRTMWDMRAFLRAHPDLNPIHQGRVFFRLPDTPKTPCMRLYRSGGAVQVNTEAPVQDVRITMEIWGSEWKEYDQLDGLRACVEDVFDNVPAMTPLNPGVGNTMLMNASLTTAFDAPDPDTGWPRIIMDVMVTVIAWTPTVVTPPA